MKGVHGELQCSSSYLVNKEENETLEDFLDYQGICRKSGEAPLIRIREGVEGFNMFMERYMKGLPIEPQLWTPKSGKWLEGNEAEMPQIIPAICAKKVLCSYKTK